MVCGFAEIELVTKIIFAIIMCILLGFIGFGIMKIYFWIKNIGKWIKKFLDMEI